MGSFACMCVCVLERGSETEGARERERLFLAFIYLIELNNPLASCLVAMMG